MRWVPAVTGFVATLMGFLALVSVLSAGEETGTMAATPPAMRMPATEEMVTATVVDPPPRVEVAGIDDAVSATLGEAGYADVLGFDELRSDMPESVLSLLIDEHAVLLITEDG